MSVSTRISRRRVLGAATAGAALLGAPGLGEEARARQQHADLQRRPVGAHDAGRGELRGAGGRRSEHAAAGTAGCHGLG
ncbi:MAG: twin-arginine translocation signal domain-containing protein, partial [Tagaea sp.]